MPPKIKFTHDEIINAAITLVREHGFERLNARDLAKELACSVHPIFRAFNSMEGLKEAVYKTAEDIYNQCMLRALEIGEDGFLSVGLAYINFAKDEKNLFKLLFMSDVFQEQSIMDIAGTTEGDDQLVDMLCIRTGLSRVSAKELYTGIWLTTHGIASMVATNNCRYSDEDIRRLLNNTFLGLILKLKDEEEQK